MDLPLTECPLLGLRESVSICQWLALPNTPKRPETELRKVNRKKWGQVCQSSRSRRGERFKDASHEPSIPRIEKNTTEAVVEEIQPDELLKSYCTSGSQKRADDFERAIRNAVHESSDDSDVGGDTTSARPASERSSLSGMSSSQQSSQFSNESNPAIEALGAMEKRLKKLVHQSSSGYRDRRYTKVTTGRIGKVMRFQNTSLLESDNSQDGILGPGPKELDNVINNMRDLVRDLIKESEKLGDGNATSPQHQHALILLYNDICVELSVKAVRKWENDVKAALPGQQDTTLLRRAQALEVRIKEWGTEARKLRAQTCGQDLDGPGP